MAADFKDVLRRRLVDSKGAVRKAAVVCLESFLLNRTGVTTAAEVSVHRGENLQNRRICFCRSIKCGATLIALSGWMHQGRDAGRPLL